MAANVSTKYQRLCHRAEMQANSARFPARIVFSFCSFNGSSFRERKAGSISTAPASTIERISACLSPNWFSFGFFSFFRKKRLFYNPSTIEHHEKNFGLPELDLVFLLVALFFQEEKVVL
ncbi:hypothetical protein U6B65_10245 [Oscillospiraceae bacterium MB08-C2-2]|nr:hypothetical protein U6B65_10245 [Oscillospiraceae bacterium MB08-C2-2]